jgi:hypothetical protein
LGKRQLIVESSELKGSEKAGKNLTQRIQRKERRAHRE